MLTPAQIIPFLSHDDGFVREFVARYFDEASNPAPATADDVWKAIDKVGSASRLRQSLPNLPQTETSTRRLIDTLATEKEDDYYYHAALKKMPVPLLRSLLTEIHQLELPKSISAFLDQRLALADMEPDALWEQMLQLAKERDENGYREEKDALFNFSQRQDLLFEAMAAHSDSFADRVLQALASDKTQSWLDAYYIVLAGEMRLEAAVHRLIKEIDSDDDDAITDFTETSLIQIGGPAVVSAIAGRFPPRTNSFAIYGSAILGKIKLPQSLEVVLKYLPKAEYDAESFLSHSLCELVPTEQTALKTMIDCVKNDRYDSSIFDLRSDAIAVATIVGYSAPEISEWREAIAHEDQERQRRQRQWEARLPASFAMEFVDRAQKRREKYGQSVIADMPSARPPDSASAPPPSSSAPIRRNTPKVGRNDPCPCGSGKKYKKCCGANA